MRAAQTVRECAPLQQPIATAEHHDHRDSMATPTRPPQRTSIAGLDRSPTRNHAGCSDGRRQSARAKCRKQPRRRRKTFRSGRPQSPGHDGVPLARQLNHRLPWGRIHGFGPSWWRPPLTWRALTPRWRHARRPTRRASRVSSRHRVRRHRVFANRWKTEGRNPSRGWSQSLRRGPAVQPSKHCGDLGPPLPAQSEI